MGSIKFGNSAVNNIYIGGTQIKKVYKGSTLIWENNPEREYSWNVQIFNASAFHSPIEHEVAELHIINPATQEEIAVEYFEIPEMGSSTNVLVTFYSKERYSDLTVECVDVDRTLFTETVTYQETSSNYYTGSPNYIEFEL